MNINLLQQNLNAAIAIMMSIWDNLKILHAKSAMVSIVGRWNPSIIIKLSFPLGGAHAKLSCGACHKQIENNGITFVKYKLESFKCAACHS